MESFGRVPPADIQPFCFLARVSVVGLGSLQCRQARLRGEPTIGPSNVPGAKNRGYISFPKISLMNGTPVFQLVFQLSMLCSSICETQSLQTVSLKTPSGSPEIRNLQELNFEPYRMRALNPQVSPSGQRHLNASPNPQIQSQCTLYQGPSMRQKRSHRNCKPYKAPNSIDSKPKPKLKKIPKP